MKALYIILRINQLSQTLVFIQIFGKNLQTISLPQTDTNQVGYIPEVYSEPCQKSYMVLSSKVDKDWKLWNIFAKRSILDVWQEKPMIKILHAGIIRIT